MSRICLQCREPFTRDRRPWESRRLRDYSTDRHPELRVELWGHICKPCATREAAQLKVTRSTP